MLAGLEPSLGERKSEKQKRNTNIPRQKTTLVIKGLLVRPKNLKSSSSSTPSSKPPQLLPAVLPADPIVENRCTFQQSFLIGNPLPLKHPQVLCFLLLAASFGFLLGCYVDAPVALFENICKTTKQKHGSVAFG